jgi:hypothetical protein
VPGAYGAVFRLSQASPTATRGGCQSSSIGGKTHTGLDNIAFATKEQLLSRHESGRDTCSISACRSRDDGKDSRVQGNPRRIPSKSWQLE